MSETDYPRTDAGAGSLRDYRYDLVPANRRVTMTLAGSDPAQEEIARIATLGEPRAFVGKRTIEEERTDAPVAVRIFSDRSMSGVVGYVPRGLESVVLEAVARLERSGEDSRLPVKLTRTRRGWRVVLLLGLTR
ncbi:hypothetical protein QT381_06195 [Galbitalea sp. SE-J8]|uniref:hypothetical protein n=1 Tax=Galbitalea sp. SE-J8 TaxID=3054952 RepID=UPI00259D16DB|nr:hypothetical protein [Galbitalea sp. SE-J8]MDM4762592.1 hypothetical protein [Galbitalea sp. SE-J8]